MAKSWVVSTYHRTPLKKDQYTLKTKTSRSKGSKYYKKKYRGQGR